MKSSKAPKLKAYIRQLHWREREREREGSIGETENLKVCPLSLKPEPWKEGIVVSEEFEGHGKIKFHRDYAGRVWTVEKFFKKSLPKDMFLDFLEREEGSEREKH